MARARSLNLFVDVFNMTDEPNFANPSGDRRAAATFLRLTTIFNGGPTRTVQFNVRYGF